MSPNALNADLISAFCPIEGVSPTTFVRRARAYPDWLLMAVSPSNGAGVVASVARVGLLPDPTRLPTRLGRDWLLRSAESVCKSRSPNFEASLERTFSIPESLSSMRSIFFSLHLSAFIAQTAATCRLGLVRYEARLGRTYYSSEMCTRCLTVFCTGAVVVQAETS